MQDWRGLVDVAAEDLHAVGLRADGTVLAGGRGDAGACEVSGSSDNGWARLAASSHPASLEGLLGARYLREAVARTSVVVAAGGVDADFGVPDDAAAGAGASAILLGNHGSIVGAASLDDAATVAEELETACRLQLLLVGHAVRPLTAGERAALRP